MSCRKTDANLASPQMTALDTAIILLPFNPALTEDLHQGCKVLTLPLEQVRLPFFV